MKKSALACMALFVAACASNKGDFGVEKLNAKPTETVVKPKPQDEQTPPRKDEEVSTLQEPGLGFEMQIPTRLLLDLRDSNGTVIKPKEEKTELTPDKLITLNSADLSIPHAELKAAEGYVDSHDGKEAGRQRDMQYVRSGYVMDIYPTFNRATEGFRRGFRGYVYYKGINPATALPSQKVSFKGTWDYAAKAENGNRLSEGFDSSRISYNIGNWSGPVSYSEAVNHTVSADKLYDGKPAEIAHSSEFEVDFAEKTLSGNLYSNLYVNPSDAGGTKAQERKHRYSLNAKIVGNRFRGNAVSQEPNAASGSAASVFRSNSSSLEGGFFGPNGEELAGKFLADDNSLFGVFAAKQNGTAAAADTILDAVRLDGKTFVQESLTNFGNATKLFVNGKQISLLPENKSVFTFNFSGTDGNGQAVNGTVCCSNTDYLKFGKYHLGGDTAQQYLFMQGERTAVADMPVTGQFEYRGTWDAILSNHKQTDWDASADNSEYGFRTLFNVDFGKKTVSGTFTAPERVNPVLTINANIEKNGFSGTAQTDSSGFIIDPNVHNGNYSYINIRNAQVKGGFYGSNAVEMGGYIHQNADSQDSAVAVFGAKRQVKQ